MTSRELLDLRTIERIEREHDEDVSREAHEIHVADLAATCLEGVLAQVQVGATVQAQLCSEVGVRGLVEEALRGWLLLACTGRRLLVPASALIRMQVHGGSGWGPAPAGAGVRSAAAVLREHQALSGHVCLWQGQTRRAREGIRAVGADFLIVADGSIVPFDSLEAIELL